MSAILDIPDQLREDYGRPRGYDAVLHGELTADGTAIVLIAEGDDWGIEQAAARLTRLTPLLSAAKLNGKKTGALQLPATWPAVVQLGFAFNGLANLAWVPGPRLTEWITAQAVRRTSPPPEPARGWPPGAELRPYQLLGAAEIADTGRFLLMDEPGPQPATTPVWTPDGWVPLGKLTPGDIVYDSSGEPVLVRTVKHFGLQPVCRVTFSDGSSTLATGTHRWHVWSKNDRKRNTGGRVLSTDELAGSGLKYRDRSAKYYLPQQPVVAGGTTGNLPLDPYAYGALLGDGSLGTRDHGHLNLSITCPDNEILFVVGIAARELGTTYRRNRPADRCQGLSFHRKGRLEETLTGLGACVYSEDKYVHPVYLRAGEGPRRALLAGLLDTDGCVTKTGAAVEFSSASAQLAADVAWLARSLGAVVTEAKPQPAGYIREDGIKVQCLLKHRLHMRFPADGPNPFLLKRKAGPWAQQAARVQRRNPPRTFASIEPAGTAEVSCIGLDARSTRVYLTDTALIPTHNTGKTAVTICGVDARRLADHQIFPVLIVVPSWEVADHWAREIAVWAPGWGEPVMHGGPGREHRLPGAQVAVTTYATLRRDAAGARGTLPRWKPATVIADEIHLARNPKAQQSQALVRVAGHADAVVGLSGTPVTRNTGDVHPMLEAMDPASWPSKARFTARFCERVPDEYGEDKILGLNPLAAPEFFAAMLRSMRRVAKADVLGQLPPKIYSVRRPEIPPEWRHAYRTMEQDMLAELPDGGELPVMSTLAKLTRLSQLASSAADVTVTEEADERTGLAVKRYHVTLKPPSWKAESLLEILAERPGQPVAAFMDSRQLAVITGRYCEDAGLRCGYVIGKGGGVTGKTRQQDVDAFQAGKLDVIICTAGAGGLGITLTRAGAVVMLQRSLQYDLAIQPEDRAQRIGAEEFSDHIDIIDIVAQGTIDQRRRTVLRDKAGQLGQLVRDPRIVRELLGGLA